MSAVKLIIVAGMSGTGKSTTAQSIAAFYEAAGLPYTWYHEEMADHPIRWADGGEFTAGDSCTEEGMKLNIEDTYERWRRLVRLITQSGGVHIMEGCLYQNIIRYFIPAAYPRDRIVDYYDALMTILAPANPHIIHLYRPNVAESFRKAFQVRGPKWEHIITGGRADFDFSAETGYQTLALELFDRYQGEKLGIDTSKDEWQAVYRQICQFLDVPYTQQSRIAVENPDKYTGTFESADGKDRISIIWEDGALYLSPSWFTHIAMRQASRDAFILVAFPLELQYRFQEGGPIVTVKGNYDWSISGKTFHKIT